MLTTTCDGIVYEELTWDEIEAYERYLDYLDQQYKDIRPPIMSNDPYEQGEDDPF